MNNTNNTNSGTDTDDADKKRKIENISNTEGQNVNGETVATTSNDAKEFDEERYRAQNSRPTKKQREEELSRSCPYLDTIDRHVLDFDFEKLCSVTLSNINVYACLVCGKFFLGRGAKTPAYVHSLQVDHHVFMNLHNQKVYCLPDGYEVKDRSLEDIQYNLNPTYTREQILALDTNTKKSLSLEHHEYLPGLVGLNNLKHTDPFNAVFQALGRVAMLRNYVMLTENLQNVKGPVTLAFSELFRKMWNPRNFKDHISPHELLQTITTVSDKRFKIGELCDPVEFLSWFLNTVHREMGGTRTKPTIITRSFQGLVHVVTRKVRVQEEIEGNNNEATSSKKAEKQKTTDTEEKSAPVESVTPFLFLSMDVPPPPLFKDEYERNIIPQIPLFNLLSKFDGKTETIVPISAGRVEKKVYIIKKLPRYLILQIKRFSKNFWFKEKNPTIVNFPVKNLDMRNYFDLPEGVDASKVQTKYDLIANIVHEGKPGEGAYKVHILNKATGKWYNMQDLTIQEILPQEVALSESYVQIYERKGLDLTKKEKIAEGAPLSALNPSTNNAATGAGAPGPKPKPPTQPQAKKGPSVIFK